MDSHRYFEQGGGRGQGPYAFLFCFCSHHLSGFFLYPQLALRFLCRRPLLATSTPTPSTPAPHLRTTMPLSMTDTYSGPAETSQAIATAFLAPAMVGYILQFTLYGSFVTNLFAYLGTSNYRDDRRLHRV